MLEFEQLLTQLVTLSEYQWRHAGVRVRLLLLFQHGFLPLLEYALRFNRRWRHHQLRHGPDYVLEFDRQFVLLHRYLLPGVWRHHRWHDELRDG